MTHQPILALAALALMSSTVRAQTREPRLDTSGLELFWQTVAILEADREPTQSDWNRLLDHPGYRQIEQSGQRATVLRAVMPLAFMPSQKSALAELLAGTETANRAALSRRVARHLVQVNEQRDALNRFAARLDELNVLDRSRAAAGAFLPPIVALDSAPPAVFVLLFENNGFGGASVAVDLLRLMELGPQASVLYLGHELHHAYVRRVSRGRQTLTGRQSIAFPRTRSKTCSGVPHI